MSNTGRVAGLEHNTKNRVLDSNWEKNANYPRISQQKSYTLNF